ncbi:hypothetical protein M9H77_02096 [Catharanthus roseus]|uniref:Uncharacterized protein n=1 Tax=Catharanthus roseus TaxID=4058 RepID=A0ACC0C7E1_CATRO|nr:hypothetical protein M9H77_02096 [Catharanthus roseus]
MSKILRSRNKRPDKARDIPAPNQRKKDRGLLKSGLRYVALIGWTLTNAESDLGLAFTGGCINEQELFDAATDPRSRLSSSDRAACMNIHFPILGHKTKHKLVDIRLRLDMMSADEVRHWLEAPSHLLTETWTSIPTILPSACTNDYMEWFLLRTHPRIQNPINVSREFHVPVDLPMPASALMDMIAREVHRDDAEKEEKYDKIADLVKHHYWST